MAKSEYKDIRSSVIVEDLSASRINAERTVISRVAIMSNQAVNSEGKVIRKFTSEAMDDAVRVFNGALARLDHDKSATQSRGVNTGFGVYQNLRREDGKIFGDLHLWDCPDAAKVLSIAERTPTAVGNSIHCSARFHIDDDGIEIIERILPRTTAGYKPSVDLVEDPAATTTLFEEKEPVKQETTKMEYKDITIDSLKANRPDIFQSIYAQGKDSRNDEVATLTQDRDNLKKKVDDFEVKERTREREMKVNTLLQNSGLPAHAITDTFKSHLMNLSASKEKTFEQAVQEAIDDRKLAVNPGGVTGNPEKEIAQSRTGAEDISKFAGQLQDILLNR